MPPSSMEANMYLQLYLHKKQKEQCKESKQVPVTNIHEKKVKIIKTNESYLYEPIISLLLM